MSDRKPLNSLLVKPAGPDCNLACVYCFYRGKADLFEDRPVHRMSDTILEEMIKQVMTEGQESVSFGWQGGEPTLMGLDFFKKAVEFQKRYGHDGQTVGNGLQTNGWVIDEKWAEFLHEYNFLVGLSLDGPEHVHDKYRMMRNGKPTWAHTVDVAKLMLARGVAVNALIVVNDYSWQFGREIYDFHKGLGIEFLQFIPCVEADPADPDRAAPFSASGEQFGRLLCDVFDRWREDFVDGWPTTSIRFLDSLFHLYVGLPPTECTLMPECGTYVVVEHNGDVFSCDFFVEPRWRLGNVMEDKLIDLLNSPHQNEFGRIKADLPAPCKECKWVELCLGGCTKDRTRARADQGLSHFCEAYKMFFERADAFMRELAAKWIGRERSAAEEERRLQEEARRQAMSNIITPSYGTTGQKISRNAPCPCGSGKKFKKCCGR
ncbi:MAG: anaerobic sulfatase maturase [Planctomycetota bacterium]